MFDAMLQNQPKSVKKAFYQGYSDFSLCYPAYDFIILELFSDPNFSRAKNAPNQPPIAFLSGHL